MKSISIFIIFVYILLPAACFAHPVDSPIDVSSDVFDYFTSECPDKHGTDECDSACSCAEHTLFANRITHTFPSTRLRETSPLFVPPKVFISIFVPPQNMS